MARNETDRTGALYLVRPDGSGRRLLAPSGYFPLAVSWSPDGTRLLVTNYDIQLVIVNATTGAVEQLVDEYGEWGVWSPDGRQIAYTRNRESTPAFYLVNSDGTNRRRLAPEDPPTPLNSLFVWPSFSPDGKHLVAYRTGSGTGGLFRISLDGRRVPWSDGAVYIEGGQQFYLPDR